MEVNCVGGACGMHKENEKCSEDGGTSLLRNIGKNHCVYIPVQTDPGAHPASYTMGTGSLSRG
jgi:hypothetical protein